MRWFGGTFGTGHGAAGLSQDAASDRGEGPFGGALSGEDAAEGRAHREDFDLREDSENWARGLRERAGQKGAGG